MITYVDTKLTSLAVRRVVNALKKYVPSHVEIADDIDDAELVVLHINGRLERNTKYIESLDKPYTIIQYAVKSTRNPEAEEWMPMWTNAELVWSYLYLEGEFDFYHAPLGVDSDVFYPVDVEPQYLALTTGEGYLSESVREVMVAARLVGGDVAHLGPHLGKDGIDYFSGMNDSELNYLYNKCHYVSGLRRIEGFELPAAEGLLSGTRPILFDKPHYKDWYDGLAVFIPETHRDQIVKDVEGVFKEGVKPVTESEISEGKDRFNWEQIIMDFWRCF